MLESAAAYGTVALGTLAALSLCVLLQYEGLTLVWRRLSRHTGHRRQYQRRCGSAAKEVRQRHDRQPNQAGKALQRRNLTAFTSWNKLRRPNYFCASRGHEDFRWSCGTFSRKMQSS